MLKDLQALPCAAYSMVGIAVAVLILALTPEIEYTPSRTFVKPHILVPVPQQDRRSGVSSQSTSVAGSEWRCPFKRKQLSCDTVSRIRNELENDIPTLCLWDGNSGPHHPDQLSQFNRPDTPSTEDQGRFQKGILRWNRQCSATEPWSLFAVTSLTHAREVVPAWRGSATGAQAESYLIFMGTEPPQVQPEIPAHLEEAAKDPASWPYDYMVTIGAPPASLSGRAEAWPWGSSWVPLGEWGVRKGKSKLCSYIVSKKGIDKDKGGAGHSAPGHKLRHAVTAMLESTPELAGKCDLLGPAFNRPLSSKTQGLADYQFSIVIENSVHPAYMSEKIMDAVALGTVPVYWGSPLAVSTFGEGVLAFSTAEELKGLLLGAAAGKPAVTAEHYAALSARGVQQRSLDAARSFVPPERWMWDHLFACAYEWHAAHPHECRPTTVAGY